MGTLRRATPAEVEEILAKAGVFATSETHAALARDEEMTRRAINRSALGIVAKVVLFIFTAPLIALIAVKVIETLVNAGP